MYLSRLLLAAMHYNENSDRDQAVDQEGNQRFQLEFRKYKQGKYSVRQIKTDPTFGKY